MLIGKSHKIIPALGPTAESLKEAHRKAQELVVAVTSENKVHAIDLRETIFKAIGELDKFAMDNAKEGV